MFDVGHVVSAVRWLEQGMIPAPMRINLVFGVPGGIDASPEALDAMLRPLPPETFWTVTCIGRHHQRMLGLALLKGAPGIRTGLEDVAYIEKGVLAPSNAALVEMASDWPARSAARSRPRTRRRSCWGLADARDSRAARRHGARRAQRGPATREDIDARRARAVRAARLPRHVDAGDRLGGRGAAGGDLPLVPSKEALLVQLQDDFMDRLTEKLEAAMAARSARR